MARIYRILGCQELGRSEVQVSPAVMTYCDLASTAAFQLVEVSLAVYDRVSPDTCGPGEHMPICQ